MTSPTPGARRQAVRFGRVCAWTALAIGALCAAAALAAGPGYRAELWTLGVGFGVLRWAATGAIAGAVVALLGLGLLTLTRARTGRTLAVLALLLNAGVAAPPVYLSSQAQRLPKIHDISTDTDDPPAFAAVLALRRGARNPVEYRPETAAEQKRGYPDIAPLRLDMPPAQAFERAERAARGMGWQIVAVAPDALRIEATATTLFFGFKDDVVIRVRPQAPGSLVDVRSLSRIGGSDIGANAKRVRAYLRRLATD